MREQLRALAACIDDLRAAPMMRKAQLADVALTRAYCVLALIVDRIEQLEREKHG